MVQPVHPVHPVYLFLPITNRRTSRTLVLADVRREAVRNLIGCTDWLLARGNSVS